jgi:hypothetical protein
MPGLISKLIKKSHDLPFRATHIPAMHHIQPYNGWLSSVHLEKERSDKIQNNAEANS